jgi:hypothetical protein
MPEPPAPVATRPMALEHPPQSIVPQPGDTGPRMVDFSTDIQPILDKHCVSCHSGESPKGNLNLLHEKTGKFSRPYDNLVNSRLVNYRACGDGAAHFRSVPPLTHGSHRTELVGRIRQAPPQHLPRERCPQPADPGVPSALIACPYPPALVPFLHYWMGKHVAGS